MLPREAKLGDVVAGVLVVAPHAGELRGSCARDSSLEALGLADNKIRRDPAVRPASHAKFVWVGDSLCDGVIDERHVVLEILVAPIGKDGFAIVLTVTRRAAR